MKLCQTACLLFLMVFLSACSNSQIKSGLVVDSGNDFNNDQTTESNENNNRPMLNTEEMEKGELLVDSSVQIIGEENEDGSMLAKRIIFLGKQVDFAGIDSSFEKGHIFNNAQLVENTLPEPSLENKGLGSFNNMSEDEKKEFRNKMQESGGLGQKRQGFQSEIVRLFGEVIKIDDNIITLKTENGSRIVFYNEATVFEKIVK